MFVKPSRHTTQGAVAVAAVGALALTGCTSNEARTDLRPEGPPDVLAVLVLNDSVGGLVETATFCKAGDEKRPSLVGLPDFTTTVLCPEDPNEQVAMAEDASPDTFYVRVMFDELLDPSVEELEPIVDDNGLETGSYTGTIKNTQPVTFKCTGVDGQLHDLAYDGYYSPSGNAVTWPVGPSLVIRPIGDVIVPTNSMCEVTLKDTIKDKQGNVVPADQRGPFKFKISGVKNLAIDPADEATVDVTAIYGDNFYVQTNAEIGAQGANGRGPTGWCDRASPNSLFSKCVANVDFAITPEPGFCANSDRACTNTAMHCDTADAADVCQPAGMYSYSLAPFGLSRAEFGFGPFGYPETEATYTFEIKDGAMVNDRCGAITTYGAPSVDKNTKVTVKTNKFDLKAANAFVPNNGDTIPSNRGIKISFTAPLPLAANGLGDTAVDFDPSSFTISPQPFKGPGAPITNAEMISTQAENDLFLLAFYQPNTEYTFTLKAGAKFHDNYGKEVTNAADKVIKFKTQPIAITASSPANGATVTKATPTSITTISFTFNQAMDSSTFTADDIEIVGPTTTLTFTNNVDTAFGGAVGGCTDLSNLGFDGLGSTTCAMQIRGVFAPGDYTIKLKKDAVIKDALGNDYVQPADRVIKFTVEEAAPAPVIPCLGAGA